MDLKAIVLDNTFCTLIDGGPAAATLYPFLSVRFCNVPTFLKNYGKKITAVIDSSQYLPW